MASFDIALEKLLHKEGGWCHVPGDKGGETYCGISRKHWPGWGGWPLITKEKLHVSYEGGAGAFSKHLAALPALREQVASFYRSKFWDKICAETMPQALANELLEQAVNLGVLRAVTFLQKACNALNFNQGKALFADLHVDGAMGAKTRAALEQVLAGRGVAELLVCLNLQQGTHYVSLAAAGPSQRKFLAGWLKRAKEEKDAE